MSPRRTRADLAERVADSTGLVVAGLAMRIRDERRRRGWTMSELAARSGLSVPAVHAIEHGRRASLPSYVALGLALHLEPAFELHDERRRRESARATSRRLDPVHAAMGEFEASHLEVLGFPLAIDEPYQHYQFAGRADLVAWRLEPPAILHVENRTRFPAVGEIAGAWNAKRSYLAPELAGRLGIRGFLSETHVMVCLWSSEVLHALRMQPATFRALAPDPPAAFEAWWAGRPPERGRTSSLVVLDPFAEGRQRRMIDLTTALTTARPRVSGYAEATSRLSVGAGPARG
jgi:transcriptional regulator with XRE-family HTH domain